MLFQLLRARGTAVTPGYQPRAIAAIVKVRADGEDFDLVANPDDRGKRGRPLSVPYVKRTVASRPILFADGADYLFGIPDAGTSESRAIIRRDLHMKLATLCAAETGSKSVRTAVAFLARVRDDMHLRQRVRDLAAQHPGDLCVQVGDRLLTDEPDVQSFWARHLGLQGDDAQGDTTGSTVCAVCGKPATIPEMWPVAIKGGVLPGGQSSGTQLVSMNSDVFESFGQRRATGGMTCGPCAECIVNALNDLLTSERTRLRIGGLVYGFWTDGPDEISLDDLFLKAEPETVRRLYNAPFSGTQAALGASENARFYVVALGANASRAVLRDWIDIPVVRARENLSQYFDAQAVPGLYGEPPLPIKLTALAGATVRDLRELRPEVTTDLFRRALCGGRLPASILAAVVRRCTAEDAPKVTRPQASLITWYLTSIGEPNVPHALDGQSQDSAYLCGRLLAEIDALQRDALRGINTTVVDRYFGAASSRPATVFGLLIKDAQNHISKLRKTRPATANAHQQRLEEIMEGIGAAFPATLALTAQGRFCLGYYHQRAASRKAALAHLPTSGQVKQAAEVATSDTNGQATVTEDQA